MNYTTIIAITATITQTVNRPTFVIGAHLSLCAARIRNWVTVPNGAWQAAPAAAQ